KEAVASSIWLLFFLLECDSKLTHYHPNWLNFNSDNYPARGGLSQNLAPRMFIKVISATMGTITIQN
ncbi:hypothetical protein, partial [Vibrio vulnificus]|uniref:hypothetical protein n=1 Tax=Vibrio vulnificus TaxID=672 RepID=UPI00405929F5